MDIQEYIKNMNKLNAKYKSILALKELLNKNNIPHELLRIMDGWKIAYPNNEECIFDVIEHYGSYGNEEDLMEAYGDGIVDVEGFMDIQTALLHFKRVHSKVLLQQYREIGTVEEFQTLKEKNEPKKPILAVNMMLKDKNIICPNCEMKMPLKFRYCNHCGQHLDWEWGNKE